jgi:hypothetical protein
MRCLWLRFLLLGACGLAPTAQARGAHFHHFAHGNSSDETPMIFIVTVLVILLGAIGPMWRWVIGGR